MSDRKNWCSMFPVGRATGHFKGCAFLGFLVLFVLPGITSGADGTRHPGKNLPRVVLKPEIVTRPAVVDPDPQLQTIQSALELQLFKGNWILDEPAPKNHRIVGIVEKETASVGQRLVIEASDRFRSGDLLTVHRPGEILRDPEDGRILGRISETLGIVEIIETGPEGSIAVVVRAFKEIMAGDRVDSFLNEKTSLKLESDPGFNGSGPILHIENNLNIGGEGQVVAVGLGTKDRVFPGLILPVHRTRPSMSLHETEHDSAVQDFRIDSRPVAEVVLFRIAAQVSLALIIRSNDVVEKGDRVGTRFVSREWHENP
ncbi:MAG: hypothetical protein HQL76_07685 [Magnetococcales bacterium]|nr:hypothetical protein [Magnetococcales bacterium]